MKFLLDQSTDARLVPYLRQLGHDVTRIASDYAQGLPDKEVLNIAQQEKRILITDDRDFGELVFRLRLPHNGVIFFRLGNYAPLMTKIDRLAYVISHYSDRLNNFIVVTKHRIRVRSTRHFTKLENK